MDYSQFVQQVKSLNAVKEQTQQQEQVADARDFAKLDEEVTPEMRELMMRAISELSRATSKRTTDIDTERK